MAKNIVMRKKIGDKWDELYPATIAQNVALADGKTVQAKMNEMKIRTYASISDLDIERGQESSLKQIIDAMVEHSKLSESIWYDKSFYPTTNGTIVIDKVDAGRVSLFFIDAMGTGHLWQASYDQNTFSGWRRVMTDNEVSNPNLLINGDFQVWQGGISFDGVLNYTSDMWKVEGNTQAHVEQHPPIQNGFKYSARVQVSQLNSSSEAIIDFKQYLEHVEILNGKKATFSGTLKLDEGVKVIVYLVRNGLGIVEKTLLGDGSVQTFSISSDIETGVNTISVIYRIIAGNLAIGKGMNIQCSKLELGEIATAFVPKPYTEELMLCKRYYQRAYTSTHGSYAVNWDGYVNEGYPITHLHRFAVPMRIAPTVKVSDIYTSNFSEGVTVKEVSAGGFVCEKTASGTGQGRFIVWYEADARL